MPQTKHLTAAILYGLLNRSIVFLLLVALTFVLPRLMPGDQLELKFQSDVARVLSPSEIETMRDQMGLSGSWVHQFFRYCSAITSGDLGYSTHHATPVAELLQTTLPWTALLILGALPIYMLAAVAGGIEAGRDRGWDRFATPMMTVLSSIPPFVTAVLLLLLFGVVWPVLPTSGALPIFPSEDLLPRVIEVLRHAILPILALALHETVRFYFLSRGEAITLSGRPFLVNARARGVYGWRERTNYYGRNMLPILLARMSDSITGLVGAVLYVEIVFSYPGVGHLIYDAILDRDYVLLQGIILGLSAVVLTLNGMIDVSIAALTKRG